MNRFAALLMVVCVVALQACTSSSLLKDQPPIALDRVPVHFHSLEEVQAFAIAPADWGQIKTPFEQSLNPHDERLAIRQAIGRIETIAGSQTPTGDDLSKNQIRPGTGGGGVGRCDCRDESTNTTTYLVLLQQQGLLKFHQVMGKAFRDPLRFDVHWTAQIREISDGTRWAVDSWYLDNGEPPYVAKIDHWMNWQFLPREQWVHEH